jgi:hypothetical protein
MTVIKIPHINKAIREHGLKLERKRVHLEILNQIFKDFSKSLFYPAGGTDLQVLLRFSSLVDVVVSPTFSENLSVDTYHEVFQRKCAHLNAFYNRVELEYLGYELHPLDLIDFELFETPPQDILNQDELEYYKSQVFNIQFQERYIAEFKFKRKLGNAYKEVSWIAMNTEGMATLAGIVKITRSHPALLCTIQQGEFEYPNSSFARLINHLQLSTKIWIRGSWKTTSSWITTRFHQNIRPTSIFPPYSFIAQGYVDWYSPMGEQGQEGEENNQPPFVSEVCAFAKEEIQVPSVSNLRGKENQIIRLINVQLGAAKIRKYDVFFSPIHLKIRSKNSKYWEQYTERTGPPYPRLTLTEALDLVQKQFISGTAKKIGMIPIGFEDEANSVLGDFVKSMPSGCELNIHYVRPLDFIQYTHPDFL